MGVKKWMVMCLVGIFILTGCQNVDKKDETSADDSGNMQEECVTAEYFMEFYSLTEDEVPIEYVQSYIDFYNLTEAVLVDDAQKGRHIKDYLLNDYANGEVFGYDINYIFQGPRSAESLSDYMKQAEVIMFRFGMHYGSELATPEIMVIDLKEGNIYYTRECEGNYIDFEMTAKLSDDDVEAVRQELPNHIEENKESGDFGGYSDYTFMIKMLAADGTVRYYDGNQGDEEHFPGFDEYWMNLYKTYFNEEYNFEQS
jgi:hypothetical protein